MPVEKPIEFRSKDDLPELVISQATSLWNCTGAWRYIKPRYLDKVPPCNQGCPVGNDIEGFIRLVEQEKFTEAWLVLKQENPFPRVCGRVCYHPCEIACNRAQFDRAVAINDLERFVGDQAPKNHAIKKYRAPSGKKVAVIGAGPSGLSAAYQLVRLGHQVVVFEEKEKPGGILQYGIPEYRLPKKVLDEEIVDITNLGVDIQCQKKVGQDVLWKELESFDAVYVAVGAHQSRGAGMENEDAKQVMSGLSFLEKVIKGEDIKLGAKTVVIGGGNTAIDAARSAIRLGGQVAVHYYRSRNEIPAFHEEVDEAEKEGVQFNMLSQPVGIIVDGEEVVGIEMQKTKLGEPDESGRRRPVPIEGSEYVVQASSVIIAIGEDSDLSFLPKAVQKENGRVLVDQFGLSKHPGVFAGGDAALVNHNVAVAIGSGKSAAIAIDRYLAGEEMASIEDRVIIGEHGAVSMARYVDEGTAHKKNRFSKTVVSFEEINKNYFSKKERSRLQKLTITDRSLNFLEVNHGLSKEAAQHDALRCFHCGVCTMCDNCYIYCPDVAVMHKGTNAWGYDINFDYCKGCGVCVHECPRSAMIMEDEE